MKSRLLRLYGLFLVSLLALQVAARESDSLRVSLLTAYPGADIYQLEGHTALRIRHPQRGDYVVNWGLFDFDSPGFVYRFVKGETDYLAGATSTDRFLYVYRREGRRVDETELKLTPEQTQRLLDLIDINLMPENRVYRYNYVLDNCATRPLAMIERALGDTIPLGRTGLPDEAVGSFRDAMRHYHAGYPWYQFGIDLALGSGIDRHITHRELSFSPMALKEMIADSPVGGSTVTLLPGVGETAVLPPTPFLQSPVFFAILVLLAALVCTRGQLSRRAWVKFPRIFDTVFYTLLGLNGCVTAFLVFISVHEATLPNWLLLFTNPLCFLGAICVWSKRLGGLLFCYQCINFALLIALMIVLALGIQATHTAVVLLVVADAVRSFAYIKNRLKPRCLSAKTVR